MNKSGKTVSRKADHVRICLDEDVEMGESGLDCVRFIHRPLPEIDREEIITSCEVMGRKLKLPILISAMTGGYEGATDINRSLARAAQKYGIAFGLGSMRAMIEESRMSETYAVRDLAPDILLLGNIGLPQLLMGEFEPIFDAMERIEVDGIAVHLNALQEATQPEGETNFKGGLAVLRDFTNQSRWPVIVKETGAGIPRETALCIEEIGVKWLDVGGLGGTSFSAVESYRATNSAGRDLASSFSGWGIPTAASLAEVRSATGLKIIASGGIRNGLDAGKCIAIGADLVGLASPVLKALTVSEKELDNLISLLATQMVSTMFLTGSKDLDQLRESRLVLGGWLRSWLLDRGIDVSGFSQCQ